MIISNASFYFSAIAALLAFKVLPAFGLTYDVTPPKIAPGQRAVVKLRLEASLFPDEEELPIINDKLLLENKNYEILEQRLEKEGDHWVWRYELTAYQNQTLTVPPVEVRVGGESYSAEAVQIQVEGTRQQEDTALRPEYGKLEKPFPWLRMSKLLSVLLLAVGICLFWFYFKQRLHRYLIRRKPQRIKVSSPPAPPEDPKEWLQKALLQLRRQISRGETLPETTFVDRLTQILREYYERKHHLPAKAFTTKEILRRLPHDDSVVAMQDVFAPCDSFKFDPRHGFSETDLSLKGIEQSERILLC